MSSISTTHFGVLLLSGPRTAAHMMFRYQQWLFSILEQLPRRVDRDFVFGDRKGPFSGWSKSKERLDQRINLTDWRLHDLRHTLVTGMAELGVEPHVIEAVVNRISGHKAGVAGVYNRATYNQEKRRALQK